MVQRYPIKSEVVIGHIRQANVGKVCLSNTHPFVRELWGRNWRPGPGTGAGHGLHRRQCPSHRGAGQYAQQQQRAVGIYARKHKQRQAHHRAATDQRTLGGVCCRPGSA